MESNFDPSEIQTVQWPGVVPTADSIGNFSIVNNTVLCSVPVGCFLRYSVVLSAIYCVAYGVVLVVGIIGNVCAFIIVVRDKSMHSVYYKFMANLAIADLLVLIFCLPVTLLGNLFGPWILGLFLCKAVAYLQGVSVCASVTTLVAISVDRFLAICYPMTWQITPRGCRFIVATIWIFSFSLSLPWTIYFRLIAIGKTSDDSMLYVCREVWPSEQMGTVYFIVANLILCYLFPLLIFLVCYGLIWCTLCRRVLPGEGAHNKGVAQRSKIKVIKMLFVVVMVFMVSWLPLYAVFARVKMGDHIVENSLEEYIIQVSAPVAQWFGASNSCVNPLLYAFFNEKLRSGFKSLLFGESRLTSNSVVVRLSSKTRTLENSRRGTTFSLEKKGSSKENVV